jgi:hypothetical protein
MAEARRKQMIEDGTLNPDDPVEELKEAKGGMIKRDRKKKSKKDQPKEGADQKDTTEGQGEILKGGDIEEEDDWEKKKPSKNE